MAELQTTPKGWTRNAKGFDEPPKYLAYREVRTSVFRWDRRTHRINFCDNLVVALKFNHLVGTHDIQYQSISEASRLIFGHRRDTPEPRTG